MPVQIDQIFTAKAENIQAFLSSAGQGCYVPAYQRAYSWDQDNVDRLFEDVINGLNHLMGRPDAISFMGTIIAIHDTQYALVKPIFRSEVAQRVMTIIDGQQRISTSVMINIALHARIRTLLDRLARIDGEQFDWVREQGEQALQELWGTFVLEQASGVPEIYKYYPRVIRSGGDVWSKRGNQAVYTSPISALIWSYIGYVKGPPDTKAFRPKAPLVNDEPDPRHQMVTEVYNYVVTLLNRVTNRAPESFDFPDVQQAFAKSDYIEALWGFTPSDAATKYVLEGAEDRNYAAYEQLVRTLLFFKYFCTRVALTVVTTRTEDDAFDMFEALNTTGEPLTAYETFRPKVIDSEGYEQFEESPSFSTLTRIDQYLERYKKADDRQRATSEMLIPYALAETGDKLPKNLSDQRRYLRDSFERLASLDEKRGAVASMAYLAAFIDKGWTPPLDDTPKLEGTPAFDDVTGFAFQALRNLKHSISIAPMARFYDGLRRAQEEDRTQAVEDLFGAIRASTAFSMLWRGGKGGTSNIDAVYRRIMRDGEKDASIPPLAKRVGGLTGVISLANFKRALRLEFEKEFPSREDWVKVASRVDIYNASAVVAKFLLLAASHDTIPDEDFPGFIKAGRKGIAPTMKSAVWRSDATFTVEHIAPRSRPTDGWDQAIYERGEEAYDRLGNLVLLPGAANSYVSDRVWAQKRLLYRYFSAKTDEAAQLVRNEFAAAGLTVSINGELILGASEYMPMCTAVASIPDDWTVARIDERSRHIAGLAYDNLFSWLV